MAKRPMRQGSTILKRIDLGFDMIEVSTLSDAEMRDEADCDSSEMTPDGLWIAETKTIYLRAGLSARAARKTLLHELGHAAWDLYNEHE